MKQGCGKGKGRLRHSPAVPQDGAPAPPLLRAPWVMLGRWSLSHCFSGCCLWLRWAPPGCWDTFSHTSTPDKHPLCSPDWLPQSDHVPQGNWDDPPNPSALSDTQHPWSCWHQGLLCPVASDPHSEDDPLLMWKGARIKHPAALCTLPGEAGGKPCMVGIVPGRGLAPQRSTEGGNGVSRTPGYRAGWAGGSTDPSHRYRYPSRGWEALTQPLINMRFG